MKKIWQSIKHSVFNSYWWDNIWYVQISSRIRPRNAWLTSQIPRVYQDKDHLMETCVLGALKHYVEPEGEDCFNVLSITSPPEQAEFMSEVKRQYELATQKLVALQKELDVGWDAIPHRTLADINKSTKKDYRKMYGKIDRLEKEIYDLQTEIMVWVIKNRNGLWT